METNRGLSPTPSTRTPRLAQTNLKNSTKYNFRVQSAPPLSLKQFLRSSVGVLPGNKEWQHSGKYREPVFRSYLSPEVRVKPKPPEPVWHPPGRFKEKPPTSLEPTLKVVERKQEPIWHPPGRYKEKPPTSLDPELRIVKPKKEPVWKPAGKPEKKPVPYFDPPNLRWSLQDLLRSMPEMRPKTFRASTRSTSMSTIRKSMQEQDT